MSNSSVGQVSVLPFTFDDPLDLDLPEDEEVITTRRALCRVATVAAEAGARFQREASPVDPMAWMLSPRQMFDGRSALEACVDRDHFVRAVVLHGLSLGVDADPSVFDWLAEGAEGGEVPRLSRPRRSRGGRKKTTAGPSLYCATIAFEGGGVILQAFHASVARHPAEIVHRLRLRFGEDLVELTDVRQGFDPGSPLAIALVPGAIADLLRKVEQHSDSPQYAAFSYDTEQRLEA
jgi:hypothetical protein